MKIKTIVLTRIFQSRTWIILRNKISSAPLLPNRNLRSNRLQSSMSENQYKPKYEYLDRGFTATIYRLPYTRKVCKSFWEGYRETHFPVEKSCYEIFTSHSPPPTILKYYGVDSIEPAGLILELAENGNLYKYLWNLRHVHKTPPSHALLYRWASQAASALAIRSVSQ